MGLKLSSPIVVSACNLSRKTDNIAKMEDCGAGAVVLHSLFEEHLQKEQTMMALAESASGEIDDSLPGIEHTSQSDEYMEKIRRAKERVNIPVIGSLNGISLKNWTDQSIMMEQAGADAIEVNIFFVPGDIYMSSSEVEHRYLNIISAIKQAVKIPVAIKLNSYFSATGNMAVRMQQYGADGLVLFNRFYQPDFDIQKLSIDTTLQYSETNEIKLPLLWIALLYGKLNLSLAATTGVQSAVEVIKYILAGADVVMIASSLYKKGIDYITTMNKELRSWMQSKNFENIQAFRGLMSQQDISDPTAYERGTYIRILQSGK